MTGCISIWVKNLTNVANVADWVGEEYRDHTGRPVCKPFSWSLTLLFSVFGLFLSLAVSITSSCCDSVIQKKKFTLDLKEFPFNVIGDMSSSSKCITNLLVIFLHLCSKS